jgi:hypothetical protein
MASDPQSLAFRVGYKSRAVVTVFHTFATAAKPIGSGLVTRVVIAGSDSVLVEAGTKTGLL